MKLDPTESSPTCAVYRGQFPDCHFKLVVPSADGLTALAKEKKIHNICSLYVGQDKGDLGLAGQFFVYK
eukprot:m.54238 g.54238  ORF g.54238 m.54238 type:complete len:69 (-) comp12445_c0_seq1:25-231(-)